MNVLWAEGWQRGTVVNSRVELGARNKAVMKTLVVYEDGDTQWHTLDDEEYEIVWQPGDKEPPPPPNPPPPARQAAAASSSRSPPPPSSPTPPEQLDSSAQQRLLNSDGRSWLDSSAKKEGRDAIRIGPDFQADLYPPPPTALPPPAIPPLCKCGERMVWEATKKGGGGNWACVYTGKPTPPSGKKGGGSKRRPIPQAGPLLGRCAAAATGRWAVFWMRPRDTG